MDITDSKLSDLISCAQNRIGEKNISSGSELSGRVSIVEHLSFVKEEFERLDRRGMSDDIGLNDQRDLFRLYLTIDNKFGVENISSDLSIFLLLNAYRYIANATHLANGSYVDLRREINEFEKLGSFSSNYAIKETLRHAKLNDPSLFVKVRDAKEFLILKIGQTMVQSLQANDLEAYLQARESLAAAFGDKYISYDRMLKFYDLRIDALVRNISKTSEDIDYQNAIRGFYDFAHVLRATFSKMSEIRKVDLRATLREKSLPLIRATRINRSSSARIARGELRGFLKSMKVAESISRSEGGAFLEEALYGGCRHNGGNPLLAVRANGLEVAGIASLSLGIGALAGYPWLGLGVGIASSVGVIPGHLASLRLQKILDAAQEINPRRPNAAHLAEEFKRSRESTSQLSDKIVERYLSQIDSFEHRVASDPSLISINLSDCAKESSLPILSK